MQELSGFKAFFIFIGSLLISFSITLFLRYFGKIDHIGIHFRKMQRGNKARFFEKYLSFITGLILIPTILNFINGQDINFSNGNKYKIFDDDTYSQDLTNGSQGGTNLLSLILGGFLMGVGTKMTKGSTLNHAIIGIPKMQKQSIVIVLLSIEVAVLVSTFKSYIPFLSMNNLKFSDFFQQIMHYLCWILFLFMQFTCFYLTHQTFMWFYKLQYILNYIFGAVLGIGLTLCGFCSPSLFRSSLAVGDQWNSTVTLSLISTVVFNSISFNLYLDDETPKFERILGDLKQPNREEKNIFNKRLLFGAAIMGSGLGLSGLQPMTALINLFTCFHVIVIWLATFASGQTFYQIIKTLLGRIRNQNECGEFLIHPYQR
ncbi:UNKNOWN [Stylonychia lemnae]|uniref:Sulphur transport domain-containing protein n=1 Tax=Stylonychia lemnae TaxID=5949 RepID=A0A078AZ84_STYLE|nr:UNKNOWN [Stylonychia lemnae]|eukprot:CDW86123.1 UNKNOWN [Stylonychia lemnae]